MEKKIIVGRLTGPVEKTVSDEKPAIRRRYQTKSQQDRSRSIKRASINAKRKADKLPALMSKNRLGGYKVGQKLKTV